MLKHRFNSFKFAIAGLFQLFRSEANAKIHLSLAILAILAGLYFSISPIEWCIVVLCIVLVISAEAFNTAIEALTDLVSPDYHDLAKTTKDVAAAAVLLIAIGAAIAGGIIFIPKIINFFS